MKELDTELKEIGGEFAPPEYADDPVALEKAFEKYPDAKLFVLIPYSQTHADTIRACCEGRDYITIIETEGWDPATTDGIHLSAIGARSAGKKLAAELKKHLGEDFFA